MKREKPISFYLPGDMLRAERRHAYEGMFLTVPCSPERQPFADAWCSAIERLGRTERLRIRPLRAAEFCVNGGRRPNRDYRAVYMARLPNRAADYV